MESLTIFFRRGGTPPTMVSAGTTNTTHIQIIFSESMTVTTAGWSFEKNGSNLAITSVAGAGTTWTFLVAAMAYGDTLTVSYDSATGSTVSSVTGIELEDIIDAPVTNNIPAPTVAVLVQSKGNFNTGSDPVSVTFDNPVTAGNFIAIQYQGGIGTFGINCTSNNGNTVTPFAAQDIAFQSSIGGFYVWNAAAGSTTITGSGIMSAGQIFIAEYSGVKNSADPLLDAGGAQGSTSPLVDSLTFGANSLLVMEWFNKTNDDITGLSTGLTQVIHDTTAGACTYAHELGATATTKNVGCTTSGDSLNVMVCAAFELA